MKVQYKNWSNIDDTLNGIVISDGPSARKLLATVALCPSFVELKREDGCKLLLGLGGDVGCAQFTPAPSAQVHSLMAALDDGNRDELMELSIRGRRVPMSRRYCLPLHTIQRLASDFTRFRYASRSVTWDELDDQETVAQGREDVGTFRT